MLFQLNIIAVSSSKFWTVVMDAWESISFFDPKSYILMHNYSESPVIIRFCILYVWKVFRNSSSFETNFKLPLFLAHCFGALCHSETHKLLCCLKSQKRKKFPGSRCYINIFLRQITKSSDDWISFFYILSLVHIILN